MLVKILSALTLIALDAAGTLAEDVPGCCVISKGLFDYEVSCEDDHSSKQCLDYQVEMKKDGFGFTELLKATTCADASAEGVKLCPQGKPTITVSAVRTTTRTITDTTRWVFVPRTTTTTTTTTIATRATAIRATTTRATTIRATTRTHATTSITATTTPRPTTIKRTAATTRTLAAKLNCYAGKWACANNNLCIQASWRCDGLEDCSDGSDESVGECGERATTTRKRTTTRPTTTMQTSTSTTTTTYTPGSCEAAVRFIRAYVAYLRIHMLHTHMHMCKLMHLTHTVHAVYVACIIFFLAFHTADSFLGLNVNWLLAGAHRFAGLESHRRIVQTPVNTDPLPARIARFSVTWHAAQRPLPPPPPAQKSRRQPLQ